MKSIQGTLKTLLLQMEYVNIKKCRLRGFIQTHSHNSTFLNNGMNLGKLQVTKQVQISPFNYLKHLLVLQKSTNQFDLILLNEQNQEKIYRFCYFKLQILYFYFILFLWLVCLKIFKIITDNCNITVSFVLIVLQEKELQTNSFGLYCVSFTCLSEPPFSAHVSF